MTIGMIILYTYSLYTYVKITECISGGFLSHGGTPSHPFLDGIFSFKLAILDTPMAMDRPEHVAPGAAAHLGSDPARAQRARWTVQEGAGGE